MSSSKLESDKKQNRESKVYVLTILLGILFFIVSLPRLYTFTSKKLNLSIENGVHINVVLLHTVLFTLLAYFIVKSMIPI